MGNVRSLLLKPVKKMNIDSRAEKVISREKPFAAPMHKSSKKQLEVARSVAPTFIEEQYRKDLHLDERLKNVYVKSDDSSVPEVAANPDRPLPTLTRVQEDFEYGFWEPKKIDEGRCTFRTILTFLSEYNEDPIENSPENIAAKYKLDVKDVSNILEYFRVFKMIVPEGQTHMAYAERMILPSPKKKE